MMLHVSIKIIRNLPTGFDEKEAAHQRQSTPYTYQKATEQEESTFLEKRLLPP